MESDPRSLGDILEPGTEIVPSRDPLRAPLWPRGGGRSEHRPREGHRRIVGDCGGWQWLGEPTLVPRVVPGRESEPIARLREHPGFLAEAAESIERICVESLAEQPLQFVLQALFPVTEGRGAV